MDVYEQWSGHPLFDDLVGLGLLLLACGLLHVVTQRVLLRVIRHVVARSDNEWDDALVDARLFTRLSLIVPALVAHFGVQFFGDLSEVLVLLIQRIAICVMIIVSVSSLGAFLHAVNEVYARNPEYRHRPIKGYVQIVMIIAWAVAALLVVAILMDRSPLLFLSGLAGMTAVLLLIFKDTILSLVASVQLTSNDMIHVGDWIEMPQCGADGDVIDVALHTVKVQNWDKTITTIPTHRLISESFKNWRGMSNAKVRRIKRSIFVDMSSVRFLEEEEIERFGHFALLRDYVSGKYNELGEFNAQDGRDPSINADIRRLTNVGTLRAYMLAYLKNHPKISKQATLLVRQLAPTAQGLPIEMYCFSTETDWGVYEGIQADIVDHLLAIAAEFGVRLFQNPSGADVVELAGSDGGFRES